jgi:hypothetical protein
VTIAFIRQTPCSRPRLARFLLFALTSYALTLIAGCGPAVTETTAAPTLTIFLSAPITGAAVGCFIALPDPASVATGQPFNFRNNTTTAFALIRRATGTPLTTVPASGVSPTIAIHSVLTREGYYGSSCVSGIHTITTASDSGAVALRR